MGKDFKNHIEFLAFNKRRKGNSDFAERLVRHVEKEAMHEYLNEQNILEEVGKLL